MTYGRTATIMNNTTDTLPCPFCGSTDLSIGDWYLDAGEVNSIECNQCFAGAPEREWNERTNNEWIYGNESMPDPGQRVVLIYQRADGIPSEPNISTPIHKDGSHLYNNEKKSIYAKCLYWTPIPEIPVSNKKASA